MYHDQGLPVLKYHGFGRAANITLGLPIVRTSVDHGTALDIAGTGVADSGSLVTAINVVMVKESIDIESRLLDWIFEQGELEFINKIDLLNFMKYRTDESLVKIGIEPVFNIPFEAYQHMIDQLMKKIPNEKITIYNEDFLKSDSLKFNAYTHIIGNLPYNISTPLIFHLLSYTDLVCDMHFMLQKEVAERITAKISTKAYGRMSDYNIFIKLNIYSKFQRSHLHPPQK